MDKMLSTRLNRGLAWLLTLIWLKGWARLRKML